MSCAMPLGAVKWPIRPGEVRCAAWYSLARRERRRCAPHVGKSPDLISSEPALIAANYFHDGYTQHGYLAAVPRKHGALRFTFRPALVEERSQLTEAARALKPYLYDRRAAAFTAEKIVAWDLVDARQTPVPPSGEALLRLQPDLFVKLHQIVAGWRVSDVDPTWPAAERERALDDELAAAEAGKPPGEVREERDAKNCSWG
jgi:hypothetical protein